MAVLKVSLFVAVVTTTIISVSSRAVNISNTWVLPEEGFPVFYRYFRDRISWNEADAVCQFHHANLVTVDTASQYDAVRAYLKELDIANNVWIGLSRISDKRNFTWRDFRTLSLMDYWQEAIPAGNDPLCTAMDPSADFRWHALSCGGPAVAAFICELPVPSWANGPKGCLLTELPSLTVLYIPEQSAVELTSDCGLGGTKRIACKGNTDRDEMVQRLACTSDLLDDKTQSPVPTTMNQESTYVNTNTVHTTNTKTTKPWIWTSNTIDTGDYGLPTRHRRETEDTMSPSSTKSTTDFSTKKSFAKGSRKVELLTTETIVTTATTDLSTTESETDEAKPAGNDEFPGAINQGQLFSIIENGSMFDIIELNGTDDNKTAKATTTTPATENLYTTVIYHKEPTEDAAASTHYKLTPTAAKKSASSMNDLPSQPIDKTLSKEVEMFPIIGNSLIKLNRTNRKEVPMMKDKEKNVIIDIDNNIPDEKLHDSVIHKTVEITIHKLGSSENVTKSTLFVTTKHSTFKSADKSGEMRRESFDGVKLLPNEAREKGVDDKSGLYEKSRYYTGQEEGAEVTTTPIIKDARTPAAETLGAEPTTKPNRQRQLTRPQRRSFYPYFFSRVLG